MPAALGFLLALAPAAPNINPIPNSSQERHFCRCMLIPVVSLHDHRCTHIVLNPLDCLLRRCLAFQVCRRPSGLLCVRRAGDHRSASGRGYPHPGGSVRGPALPARCETRSTAQHNGSWGLSHTYLSYAALECPGGRRWGGLGRKPCGKAFRVLLPPSAVLV